MSETICENPNKTTVVWLGVFFVRKRKGNASVDAKCKLREAPLTHKFTLKINPPVLRSISALREVQCLQD